MEIALKSMGGKSNLKESSIRKHAIMYSEYFLNDGKIQNTWRGASVTIFSIRWIDIALLLGTPVAMEAEWKWIYFCV